MHKRMGSTSGTGWRGNSTRTGSSSTGTRWNAISATIATSSPVRSSGPCAMSSPTISAGTSEGSEGSGCEPFDELHPLGPAPLGRVVADVVEGDTAADLDPAIRQRPAEQYRAVALVDRDRPA